MSIAGYSNTPLAKKLGLHDGQSVAFCGLPNSLEFLTEERSYSAIETRESWTQIEGADFDYMHLFTDRAADVNGAIPAMRNQIKPDGMIWMSWPKKASKVPTDVTEDVIRNRALSDVLVDIKVCAVDEIWSGLKLVIRKELRQTYQNSARRSD